MNEFELIRRYFRHDRPARQDVRTGVGDDAAVLRTPPGKDLVSAIDTLVEGRHFPQGTSAYDIGWKALAVNLSDLAAMGAEPAWFTLALTLPQVDEVWLDGFARGLFHLAEAHGIELVGGDTTRGPLTVSVAVHGLVTAGRALLRSGAVAGDVICVTGTVGDAALALESMLAGDSVEAALEQRLNRPQPRVASGLALGGLAHAAIDISDGLAADLGHVLEASGVGATVEIDSLPLSAALTGLPLQRAATLALTGGDDYELCVCLPVGRLDQAQRTVPDALTPIGRVVPDPGLRLRRSDGAPFTLERTGYAHFP